MFFTKECYVLYVLLCSLLKNVMFFTKERYALYVLCKRTQRSLCSFTFFRKERKRKQRSFGFYKSPKITKTRSFWGQKWFKNGKKLKKERKKRTKRSCVLLQKNDTFFAFFYVLCKRTLHSLRSFTYFAKECIVLCVLLGSLEKKVKERNILLGFISRQKRQKRSFWFHKWFKIDKKL